MELVLPRNYVEIDEEEMMYLEGGDARNFANNIYGLVRSATIRRALGIPSWLALAKMSLPVAMSVFPGTIAKISSIVGGPIGGLIGGLGAVGAIIYLWNVRAFY